MTTSRAPARAPRTQDQRRAETRGKLLTAAIKSVHRHGYAALTMGEVAKRSGMSIGALQHHFPSRDDLLISVLNEVFPADEFIPDLEVALRLPLRQRVDLLVDSLWRTYGKPEYLVLWQIVLGTIDNKKLRRKIREYRDGVGTSSGLQMAALFPDVGMAEEEVVAVVSFVKHNLRGLTLMSAFQGEIEHPEQLQLLKEATFKLISGAAEGITG